MPYYILNYFIELSTVKSLAAPAGFDNRKSKKDTDSPGSNSIKLFIALS